MEIRFVKKDEIYPRFGRWIHEADGKVTLLVRADLPKCMRDFLLDHETGHEEDKQDGDYECDSWIENELEVNWWAAEKHPLGAILTVLYSFAPYRLSYYWKRFKEGK